MMIQSETTQQQLAQIVFGQKYEKYSYGKPTGGGNCNITNLFCHITIIIVGHLAPSPFSFFATFAISPKDFVTFFIIIIIKKYLCPLFFLGSDI